MNISTRFNLGQKVWQVALARERVWKKCSVCSGTGNINLHAEEYRCPKCYGRQGQHRHKPLAWTVSGPFTVGLVRPTLRTTMPPENELGRWKQKGAYWLCEEYMLTQTGIGSGSVYTAERLYGTEGGAQAIAEKMQAAEDAELARRADALKPALAAYESGKLPKGEADAKTG